MKKQLGDRLNSSEWQKLADLLMIARNDPLIEEQDKTIFRDARLAAIYYMGYSPRKGKT